MNLSIRDFAWTREPKSCVITHDAVEVVRALHTVLKQLESAPAKTRKPQAANAGKPWTDDDDRALREMFDQGCTDKEISNHFGRSKGAITARLVRLGKITDRVGLK